MIRCRLCGATALDRVHSGMPDFFQGTSSTEDYGRCRLCGLLQAESLREDLAPLYAEYSVHRARGRLFRRVRQWVLRGGYDYAAPPRPGARLLDYGCGEGSYLAEMRARGWSVAGVEMSRAQAAHVSLALGVPVRAAGDHLSDWEGRFDRVTLNSTLEHLEAPRETLAALLGLLRPGGALFASIPNVEGREARLFGARWFDLDPPRHRTFFTRAHLARLLGEVGYEAVRFATAPSATSFAGSLHKLAARRCDLRAYALLLPLGEAWSLFVRDGYLKVWAERPGPSRDARDQAA